MNFSILKAAAVAGAAAVLLAATASAAGSYAVSAAPLVIPSGFLSSPHFLWVAANAIVLWLIVSSYRHHRTTGAAVSSDMDGAGLLFPSPEHENHAFAAAPVVVSLSPREARAAAKQRLAGDRPRARKKKPACEGTPPAKAEAPVGEAMATSGAVVVADDVSMDAAWQSILRRGVARPVAVRKSETWGGEELPRMRRAADRAVVGVAERRTGEMRKSASMVPPSPPHPAAASSPVAAKQGWRTRDVLGMAQDELLRRAESFIRRQHEHLRIQRQESEQRQALVEHERRRPAQIRV